MASSFGDSFQRSAFSRSAFSRFWHRSSEISSPAPKMDLPAAFCSSISPHDDRLRPGHRERDAVPGEGRYLVGLKHVLVIVVFWQLLRLFLPVRFVGGSHRRIQLRGGSRKGAGFQVCDERGIDHGPVFVGDRHVRADSRCPFPPDRRQRGQTRREQKEWDLLELSCCICRP